MIFDRIVRFLLPRQGHFFTLIEEIASRIDLSAAVFSELASVSSRQELEGVADRLKPIESEADYFCQRVYAELDRTFVTPIDREDLASLTSALDDVIDEMEHTADFAVLYRFESLTEPMRQLVQINVQGAGQLTRAVGFLRMFSRPEAIREPTIAMHNLENQADAIFRGAVAALFTDGAPPAEMIRQKDILERLESGVKRCEDAMDVIRSVIVKHG
jgi:predicted phosphate transport protein (TIGR00153 family)